MLTKEHDLMAYNNTATPRLDNVIDEACYTAIRYIYQMFRRGMITEQAAREEKARFEKASSDFDRRYRFELAHIAQTAKRMKRTEAAKNAYRTNRTIENADRLIAALDGLEKGE